MARWKLLQPHHLNVPGTEWEYNETDRKTNKPKRTRFPVPLYLNPLSPDDWNYGDKDDGDIIVAHDNANAGERDYLFVGDPTPDMEPLDDEARAISDSFRGRWGDGPIEGLPAQGGYSQSLLDSVQKEFADAVAGQSKASQAQADQMKDVLSSMAAMMKQNQDLLAMLAADRVPASARRA
jgi:hypothetical protein